MTVAELKAKYTAKELGSSLGDTELRYRAFAPLFIDLYENKMVYHERVTLIIKVENLVITPERYDATAVPLIFIGSDQRQADKFMGRTWKFGGVWSSTCLINDGLGSPYGGGWVWTEPELVKRVEELALQGEYNEAKKLTVYKDWV